MRRKIVLLTFDITLPGGIERVVANMANMFDEYSDYQIKIISVFSKFGQPFYNISPNVQIEYLSRKASDVSSWFNNVKSNLVTAYCLRKFSEPGSVVISTITSNTIWLLLLKKKRNFKLIAAEHADYFALSGLAQFARKKLYRKADSVVTLVDSEKIFYEPFSRNVVCIPNALAFLPDKTTSYTSKRVIAAGRAVKEKCFDKLLKVYGVLAKRYPNWHFDLYASDGYLKEDLIKINEKNPSNVHIYPPTTQLIEEMQRSDIYVCTSSTESFSMVILEAMSCGVCPVSFDCPSGPRYLISDGENGYLVDLDDEVSLTEKISALIDDDTLRHYIGKNARKRAEMFIPELIFKKWDALINDI